MSEIRVDAIKTRAGAVPTASDVGINVAGTIIQTKLDSGDGVFISNQSSTQDSGLAVTITPTSTSNKLIISYSSTLYVNGTAQLWAAIYSGGSSISGLQHESYYGAGGDERRDIGGYFLHTPTSTNSTTFNFYIIRGSGSYTLGSASKQSAFMVQEIAQ